jgi:hypothetical protein
VQEYQYDVCLSFAGEDRRYVSDVAAELARRGIRVFYDEYEQANLWGKDLYQHLANVYQNLGKYCVIFASAAYAAKVWPRHELASAQARALREHSEYILPARFDDTAIPGLLPTTAYLDLRTLEPAAVAELVENKLSLGARGSVRDNTAPALPTVTKIDNLTELREELEVLRRKSEPRHLPPRVAAVLRLQTCPPPEPGTIESEAPESVDPFQDAVIELKNTQVHLLIDTFDNETAEFGSTLRQRLQDAAVPIYGAIGRFQWIPPGVLVLVRDPAAWSRSATVLRRGFALVPTAKVCGPEDIATLGLTELSSEAVIILVGRR